MLNAPGHDACGSYLDIRTIVFIDSQGDYISFMIVIHISIYLYRDRQVMQIKAQNQNVIKVVDLA